MLVVLLVIISIGAIVAAHEFGHFIAAKALGVKVKEFMLGLPSPKIFSFSAGDTEYGVTVLPIGGYVKFVSTLEQEDLSEEEKKEAFESQPIWKRILIILAGPVMNLVVPIVLMASVFLLLGVSPTTTIERVRSDGPAKAAGFKAGDRIEAMNEKVVTEWDQITNLIRISAKKEMRITIIRSKQEMELQVTPIKKDGKGYLGIEPTFANGWTAPFQALYQGAIITGLATIKIFQVLSSLLTQGEILSGLGSPIRITQELTKEVYRGHIFFLQSLAFISIGLAIVNLIPLPPLDGGRILLFGVEAATKKPIDKDKLIWIQGVGFLLLISLMIYLIVVDIQRLIPAVMRF